jgi:hypothetical protein
MGFLALKIVKPKINVYTKKPDPYKVHRTKPISPSSPPEAIDVNTSEAPLAKANKVTLAKVLFIFRYSEIFNKAGVSSSSDNKAISLNTIIIVTIEKRIKSILF